MNQKKLKVFISSIIIVLVIVPLIVGIGVSAPIFKQIVSSNDWIGFWGSYLGAITGGAITLFVLWYTIENNEQARKRSEKIQFFDKIIDLYSKYYASESNTLALAVRVMSSPDLELYRLYFQQANDTIGFASELSILLGTRRMVYNYSEFEYQYKSVVEKINNFEERFDEEFYNNFEDEEKRKKLENDIGVIVDEIVRLNNVLAVCVHNNLNTK